MKINSKRNLFVFVTLLIGIIWFSYFNLVMIPVALESAEGMEAFVYYLPYNISLGIAVVFSFMAYKNYTPKKMLITTFLFAIAIFFGAGKGVGLIIFPAFITSILSLFLKINQDSTKFVGR